MKLLLTLFGIVVVLALYPQRMFLIAGDFQTSKPPSEWSESEARKMLSDSPWAKRSKVHSTVKPAFPTQAPPESVPPSMREAGPSGPGTGPPRPTASEVFNQQVAGPQAIPCLGWGTTWGIGSLRGTSLPSPTSEECKAAWQSVAAVKGTGLPPGSVVILWESAVPVREAKVRLAINEPASAHVPDAFIISVIAHPMLRQINPAGSMKQMIRESAVLLRNGKNKVQASDVAFIETDDTVVRFFFPRQQTILPGDREVVFRFEMLDTLVEAKFNLKEMVYHGLPEL